MTFEVAYDFAAGKTSIRLMGKGEEKALAMKQCSAELAVIESGGSEITATFIDATHMVLMKPGGMSTKMTKKSDQYEKFESTSSLYAEKPASPPPDGAGTATITDPGDIEQLKQDLMGYSNQDVWNFDTPSEYRDFRIEKRTDAEGRVDLDVFIVVATDKMVAEHRRTEAKTRLTYAPEGNGWRRTAIGEWSVEKKSDVP